MAPTGSSLLSIPGFADPFSSLSHLLAAGVFAVLAVPLVIRGVRTADEGSRNGREISLSIFAASAVFLLSMSGVFHLLSFGGAPRAVLQRMDHAAIFVLIAGTFTPIHVILFRGVLRWGPLALIWLCAVLGVTLKSVYFTSTPPLVGLALYLAMGWAGILPIFVLWRRKGLRFVRSLLIGGLAYTAGAVAEGIEPPALIEGVIRAHEIFHVAVIVGLGFHWRFIWRVAGVVVDEPIEEHAALCAS